LSSINYAASDRSKGTTSKFATLQVEDNLAVLRILAVESQQQHSATAAAEETLRIFMNRYGVLRIKALGGDWNVNKLPKV
jgi:hypothetical protein